MVSIGEDTTIGQSAVISGHCIENGHLTLGPVFLGKDVAVGSLSVLLPHTSVDEGVQLEAMSMVPVGAALPPHTRWEGSPLRKHEHASKDVRKRTTCSCRSVGRGAVGEATLQALPRLVVALVHFLGILITLILTAVSVWPIGFAGFTTIDVSPALTAVTVPFAFLAAHFIYVALAVAVKWVVLGKTVAGRYHVDSWYGLRFTVVRICLEAPLAKSFMAIFAGGLLLAAQLVFSFLCMNALRPEYA